MESKRQMWKIGIGTQAVWLILGVAALFVAYPANGTDGSAHTAMIAARWFVVISLLCFVDLIAIVRTMAAAFEWTAMPEDAGEKRAAAAIRTLYWGAFKLACLGILGMILIRAKDAPGLSLLLGVATLVALPLVGGYFWSRAKLETV
jgi:cytochrome bd-type quinol oxidase subunit 2